MKTLSPLSPPPMFLANRQTPASPRRGRRTPFAPTSIARKLEQIRSRLQERFGFRPYLYCSQTEIAETRLTAGTYTFAPTSIARKLVFAGTKSACLMPFAPTSIARKPQTHHNHSRFQFAGNMGRLARVVVFNNRFPVPCYPRWKQGRPAEVVWMTDRLRTGQAHRFAQIPLPLESAIGKAGQGVALALPAATAEIQGQREGAEPAFADMLSVGLPEGLVLGLDAGAKTSGFAVFAPRAKAILALGELHLRHDIKGRMDDRRQNRRTRRSKKWNRQDSYDKSWKKRAAKARKEGKQLRGARHPKPGWLTPTMESKIAAHIHLVKWLAREYPFRTIVIEHGKFDLHAMKRDRTKLAGWQYQRGELYGFENVKAHVRIRDDFTCQACLLDYNRRMGKKATGEAYKAIKDRTEQRGVEVGHLTPRSRGGTNVAANLVTLCHDHNDAQGQQTIEGFGYPELRARKLPQLKWAEHVNIYVPILTKRLEELGYKVLFTRGYVTKVNREAVGLDKSDYFDAAVIASEGEAIATWPKAYLRTRWMGRRRRQQYDVKPVKESKAEPKAQMNKLGQFFNPRQPNFRMDDFQREDYVEYRWRGRRERGFIQAIMTKGPKARVCGLAGEKETLGVWSLKKLTVIHPSPRLRYELEVFPKGGRK